MKISLECGNYSGIYLDHITTLDNLQKDIDNYPAYMEKMYQLCLWVFCSLRLSTLYSLLFSLVVLEVPSLLFRPPQSSSPKRRSPTSMLTDPDARLS